MNALKSVLIASGLLFVLSACSSPEKEIVIQRVEIEKPRLNKAAPPKPSTSDVDYKLITKNTQKRLLEEHRLYYGLNEINFELHLDNLEKILKYTRQLELTLQSYIDYYEPEEAISEEE